MADGHDFDPVPLRSCRCATLAQTARGGILRIAKDQGVAMSGIMFAGSSGRNYSYLIFDHTNERQMLQSGANYAFAANDRLPIFFEATDNLKRSFLKDNKELWERAQDVHGATLLLIHPGPDRDAA